MNNLMWLTLSGAKIQGNGLAALAPLGELRQLVLANTEIDDDALVHMPSLAKLRRLDLSGTKVRGPGLARLRQLPRLEELTLDNTDVADGDLQYLDGLDQLVVLSLEGAQVTPAGAKALASLKSLRTVLVSRETIVFQQPQEVQPTVSSPQNTSGASP